ncbi:hypothetical protein [Terriglobus sp.]|uniref:hypothetical protein n=1 Tax=Terriglobus sp. TaxID=1889013 RepID=UPI003B007625
MTLAHHALSEAPSGVLPAATPHLSATTTVYKKGIPLSGHSCIRILLLFAIAAVFGLAGAQSLKVTYGAKGIQTLSFAGTVLEDVSAYPSDSFHIHHMKCEDLGGQPITSGQYGWGENNNGTAWDGATNTETYIFSWGSIAVRFVQTGNNLDLVVTETNAANSGIKLDGAEIFPLALHFPRDPNGFGGYSQFLNTTTGPAVSTADFGSGMVTAVLPDESFAMYGGWKNLSASTYSPLMSTTSPDGLAAFLPHTDHPLAPGTTLRYTLSLRFTAEGVAADARDGYTSFSSTYPSQMTWSDHRILGTAYLASSPANPGDKTKPGGFPNNPRRYFNDPSVNVTQQAGLQTFQDRVLAQAASNVANTRAMNGQGIVTWDLEGEQYPQDTSYVCSPDQIATVAPEMESLVLNKRSPYFGTRLDDAYFKTMTDAGLRVGVCVRPQVFALAPNGSASQSFLTTNSAIVANLEKKISFANTRWGVTVFYVDSTVDNIGGTLDPAIFQQLITDFPSFLFIPEETTPRYYAYSAPFSSFLFHGTIGTDPAIYQSYPKAFGVTLVNDVAAPTLQAAIPALTQAVAKGDILMGHADYWQANDPTLVSIYQAAGAASPPPVQVKPAITWNTPAAVTYGTSLSSAQLNASASTAGSFTYSPGFGSVLPGGVNTLMTTFTPADAQDYTSATAVTTLTVNRAVPTVTWPQPDPISSGIPLSAAQLSASANVPGIFTYNPPVGTVLSSGTAQLAVTFLPSDSVDYTSAIAAVSLSVVPANATRPVATWPTPASIVYGTPLSAQQLNASFSAPGTIAYVPGLNTVLPAGTSTLQAVFSPLNPKAYQSSAASVQINVTKAQPIISWTNPAPIASGVPLTSAQLNASASVAGTFQYSPAAGTVLPPGLQKLVAQFTPADSGNYTASSTSVNIPITPSSPISNSNLYITSPSAGDVLSGVVTVAAVCRLTLDSAGTYLVADGMQVGDRRVVDGPYLYTLDTRKLSNGTHILQIWAHDIGDHVTLSAQVPILVAN